MIQKEIWYADLEPVKGSEQGGSRPVVIISGNVMNQMLPIVLVCPLTTKIKNIKGCVIIKKNKSNSLKADSELLVFQIRSISKSRLTKKIGTIDDKQLNYAIDGLHLFLKY
jgi:mRNA interferase MazF